VGTGSPRSLFVSVLAWTTLVPAAFGVVVALMQNVMFTLFMSPAQFAQVVALLPPGMETLGRVSYDTMRVALLAFLALSVIFLLAGIGLLKRRNWARVVFIAAVALGTLYSVVTYFSMDAASDLTALLPGTTIDGASVDMAEIAAMMRATTTALTVVFTAFNLWLIWRLLSPAIRQEFE
jgi:uncharacterized membrane protein YozB (DUF420 family)